MEVLIHDLSLGGCLIEAPRLAVVIGSRIALRLGLPGEAGLSLHGETVRIVTRSTFAIKFLDMDDVKETRLQRILDRLMETSPTALSTLDGDADVS